MTTKLSSRVLDEAFATLERSAVAGERCPPNRSCEYPEGSLQSGATSILARAGRIRVEVFAHNWRRVTLLDGAHAGKATAAPQVGSGAPYLIIDRNGSRRVAA